MGIIPYAGCVDNLTQRRRLTSDLSSSKPNLPRHARIPRPPPSRHRAISSNWLGDLEALSDEAIEYRRETPKGVEEVEHLGI